MSEKTPVGAVTEPDFAAFVAIDWADQKHYWRLVAAGSKKQEQGELDQPFGAEERRAGAQTWLSTNDLSRQITIRDAYVIHGAMIDMRRELRCLPERFVRGL